MLPASFAACVPVFMATPTSACASAGASLVPSPVIATSLPFACSSRMSAHLGLGRGLGEKVVDAGLLRDGGGGARVVAGDHHGADAHRAEASEALADAALHDVLEVDDAEHARCRRTTDERRAALRRRSRCAMASSSVGHLAAERPDVRADRVHGALADLRGRRCRSRSCGSAP